MKNKILLFLTLLASCNTDKIIEPEPPVLLLPANFDSCNSATIIDKIRSQVVFEWYPSDNSDKYELVIENNVSKLQTKKNSFLTNIPVVLIRGVPYSWWVISVSNESLLTSKSEVWQFYLEGPSIVNHLPFPANLIDPKNKEEVNLNTESKYTLRWIGNDLDDDIESYKLIFGDSLTELEVIQQDIKTMDLEIILTKGKVYYWQVISIDSEGNSSSSQVNEFVTKE
jgi:hypothetical protein